jgi:hypothetical protein
MTFQDALDRERLEAAREAVQRLRCGAFVGLYSPISGTVTIDAESLTADDLEAIAYVLRYAPDQLDC